MKHSIIWKKKNPKKGGEEKNAVFRQCFCRIFFFFSPAVILKIIRTNRKNLTLRALWSHRRRSRNEIWPENEWGLARDWCEFGARLGRGGSISGPQRSHNGPKTGWRWRQDPPSEARDLTYLLASTPLLCRFYAKIRVSGEIAGDSMPVDIIEKE